MTQTDEKKLDTFLHKSLRRILKIYWPMHITNEEIRRGTGIETISRQVARRRLAWLGHVLRIDHNSHQMGTERQKKEGSTAGDMTQNCGKGA